MYGSHAPAPHTYGTRSRSQSAATTPGSAQGAPSPWLLTPAVPNPGPRNAKAKRAVLQDEPPADANVYGSGRAGRAALTLQQQQQQQQQPLVGVEEEEEEDLGFDVNDASVEQYRD